DAEQHTGRMRARSLAREGQLSARRPNGVRGNPPTPLNSGIVATDDPIRRREDEEGGEVNNPQIDGMNPDRTVFEVLELPNNEVSADGVSIAPWYTSKEFTVTNESGSPGEPSKSKDLVDRMPSELRKEIEQKYQANLAVKTIDFLAKVEAESGKKIKSEKEQAIADRKKYEQWSKDSNSKNKSDIIKKGVEELTSKSEAVKKYSKQKNALETELNSINGIAAKTKSKFLENAGDSKHIRDAIDSLSAYAEGYSRMIKDGQLTAEVASQLLKDRTEAVWKEINSLDKNVATSVYIKTFNQMEKSILPNGIDPKGLTDAERKVMVFSGNNYQLLFDKLSSKERTVAEQKLALAGLKPPTIDASASPEVANQLRSSYEKLVVKMAMEERRVGTLTKELNNTTRLLNTEKSNIQREVTSSISTIVAREKKLFEVKISVVDDSGKWKTITVDTRDPNLSPDIKKVADKALADKEWKRILNERNKAEAEFKLNEQFKFESALADAAVQNRLTELTTITPGERLTLEVRYPDPLERQKAADEFLTNKLMENKAEIDAIGAMWQHKDPSFYERMAKLEAYQGAIEPSRITATNIDEAIDSPSSPEFLRSKWCVAFANWSMLKRTMGDLVPDFEKFVKEVADQDQIDRTDMTLSTAAVVERYSGGKLVRKPGFGDKDVLPQDNRQAGYQIIADFLKQERPEAITLRVKDDGKGHGHTQV
ncbi:MAG: hypothetical protein MUF77_14240, partial [Leptospira sp.]|nr:hypothetical protein [Leptospira sp.]